MKNIYCIILLGILLTVTNLGVFAQEVLVEKKSKIVTYTNQIILTKYLIINNDRVSYKDKDGKINSFDMKDVKSISVKQGTTFFTVMGICMATGVALALISPTIPVVLGLASGIIAGLIVAPFIQKPLTLVYHLGEWKVPKYKPGISNTVKQNIAA